MDTTSRFRQLATDGRLIRLAIVALIGLILFAAIVSNNRGIFSGRAARFVQPTVMVVPTLPAVVPDLDDTLIFPGETVNRTLPPGGIQNWTFTSAADTVVDLAVRPDVADGERFDILVELFGPDGQLIVTLNERGVGEPEMRQGLLLPATGEYTIWISDPNFAAGGPYSLTLLPQRLKSTYPLRIGLGQTLSDTLIAGEFKFWVFSADVGQTLSITLLPLAESDAAFSPRFVLYAPDGTRVMESAPATADATLIVRDLVLPTFGDYTIWVMEDGFDHAGGFALSVQALGFKDTGR